MPNDSTKLNRREALAAMGKVAAATAALPMLNTAILSDANTAHRWPTRLGAVPVNGVAGVDRVVVLPGKTYLRGWAGYGEPPRRGPRRPNAQVDSTPPAPTGPAPTVRWRKVSGPGRVTFADPSTLITTAAFA